MERAYGCRSASAGNPFISPWARSTSRLLDLTPSRSHRPTPGQAVRSAPERPQPQLPAARYGGRREPPRSGQAAAPVSWAGYVSDAPADAGGGYAGWMGRSHGQGSGDGEHFVPWLGSTL